MGASARTVLFIVHNHPSVRSGGVEVYTAELFEAMRSMPGYDAIMLARGGPPLAKSGHVHGGGVRFAPVDGHPNQYFLYTDGMEYDWLNGTCNDKSLYTRDLRGFLHTVQPDVVHIQHTLMLGYELVREVRNALPDAPIVYTLHELLPICHRDGQMVRVFDDELCDRESPRRCHECFPNVAPQDFFARKRFIQRHLELVDLFLTPSEFLKSRYVEWGLPAQRILVEEYGRATPPRRRHDEARAIRNRSGFFGQMTPYKGVTVLLEAMRLLQERDLPDGHSPKLRVHGANLEAQTQEFQTHVSALLEETRPTTSYAGPYAREELPDLMSCVDWVIVPSVWWENSPLVIQEAFSYGRPVICSDIGGMAEKVRDGVDGLHFRVGDPGSLAEVLETAATTRGLWDRLAAAVPAPHPMERHLRTVVDVYDRLLAEKLDRRRSPAPAHGSPYGR